MRFTDLHQHVLWGMDDGPATPQAMNAMLECAVRDGVGLIAATSHADPRKKEFDWSQYEQRLDEANAYCRAMGWDLKVISGSEILYCDRVADMLRAGRLPTLGHTGYVLLEFYPNTRLDEIGRAADQCYKAGCMPIIAHVERYRALRKTMRHPSQFKEDYGLVYQMNCETLIRPHGLMERLFVRRMMEEQAIDLLASDAHDTVRRPSRMQQAYVKAREEYGKEYAKELVTFGQKLNVPAME